MDEEEEEDGEDGHDLLTAQEREEREMAERRARRERLLAQIGGGGNGAAAASVAAPASAPIPAVKTNGHEGNGSVGREKGKGPATSKREAVALERVLNEMRRNEEAACGGLAEAEEEEETAAGVEKAGGDTGGLQKRCVRLRSMDGWIGRGSGKGGGENGETRRCTTDVPLVRHTHRGEEAAGEVDIFAADAEQGGSARESGPCTPALLVPPTPLSFRLGTDPQRWVKILLRWIGLVDIDTGGDIAAAPQIGVLVWQKGRCAPAERHLFVRLALPSQ